MTVKDEKAALAEISNLLPTGYVKTVPFSTTKDVSFEFAGVSVLMSALYVNKAINCYCFDLSWSSTEKVYGIPIRCGVNMLKQFKTPLPNMYANNHAYPGEEIASYRELSLIIIDESVLVNG